MTIRAKFRCDTVTKFADGSEEVRLLPVYGTSENPANKEWSKYTPSGEAKMRITAEGAVGQFSPGQEFFVDFIPCAEPAK